VRPATPAEISHWDELVIRNPDGGHILQSRAWGEFKRRHGWLPLYWRDDAVARGLSVLVLQRSLPGLGRLWYVPKGPGVCDAAALRAAVAGLSQTRRAFTVKVEPEIEESEAAARSLRAIGLVKSPRDVQITRATILVDLRRDEDDLLASFKPKTRYNIRLAQRRGVTVERVAATDANVDTMYGLMVATQSRAGFTLRPKRYFSEYWRLHEAAGQGQLLFASWGGQVLAGIYVTFIGRKGWYKDGGSTKEHSELMAPHLLQWEAMRWLRSRDVESYDLVAVPPRDQLRPDHPLFGLYRFKSGFNETVTEFVGTWDAVVDRRRNLIWQSLVERAAHQWTYRVHHDLFY
jgi:lipid II:glycine glycyltransferase (peptidoglycan interpeptide bridge formation enzyme)